MMWRWPDQCSSQGGYENVLRSNGVCCEWGTWQTYSLLQRGSTEMFSNETWLWSLESEIVNIQMYILIPWVADRRWGHRKGSPWSGSKGLFWDKPEASHCLFPFLQTRDFLKTRWEYICLHFWQVTPGCSKDLLRWERSWNKRWCILFQKSLRHWELKKELCYKNLKT